MKINILLTFTLSALLGITAAGGAVVPHDDSFYDVPQDVDKYSPGQVLLTRIVPHSLKLDNIDSAYQIKYRTTNSLDKATATVTTLLIPTNARLDKIISYQVAEDSAWIGCAPSYTLQTSGDDTIQSLLDRGYVVNVPDYQGIDSAFTAAILSGKATLDSLRAVQRTQNLTGIAHDAKMVMTGYSGGSLATGWAAELQPTYAPELKILGAAVGGFIVNVSAVALNVNKGLEAGFVPAGLYGLAVEYPAIAKLEITNLKNDRVQYFRQALDQCVTNDLLSFAFQDVFSYWEGGEGIMYLPEVQKIMQSITMGSHTPQIPMFVYQGLKDEVIPYHYVDETINDYCADGATIEYWRNPDTSHTEEASVGWNYAIQWLEGRFQGRNHTTGCHTKTNVQTTLSLPPYQPAPTP